VGAPEVDLPARHVIVMCTCPAGEGAQLLARSLVEDRLAACVHVLGRATSVYRWQGSVQEETEQLLLIKTTAAAYPALEQALRRRHENELPEIIAVPMCAGLETYLAWIDEHVATP